MCWVPAITRLALVGCGSGPLGAWHDRLIAALPDGHPPDPTAALDIAGVCYRPLVPELAVELSAGRVPAASPLIDKVVAVLRRLVG